MIYLLTKISFKNNSLFNYRQIKPHFSKIKKLNTVNFNFRKQYEFCLILRHYFSNQQYSLNIQSYKY